MRAVALERFGGPEVLQIRNLPIPEPAADEILIAVSCAGVNPADWKDREGFTAQFMGATFPYTPGFDAAGTVAAVGPDVSTFFVGQRVFTPSDHGQGKAGSYAEYVIASEASVAAIPDTMDFATAAALPVAALTAWQALFDTDRGALSLPGNERDQDQLSSAGESHTVMINGGAGGLGGFAIALAHWAGCTVAATCGASNLEYVEKLGADVAIDYTTQPVKSALLRHFPQGVDLLVDCVGASSLPEPLGLIREGGTLISIPTLVDDGEVERDTQAAAAEGKRKVFGFMKDRDTGAQLAQIAQLIVDGAIPPPPLEVFPLEDVAAAHTKIQAGHVRGKLVLAV